VPDTRLSLVISDEPTMTVRTLVVSRENLTHEQFGASLSVYNAFREKAG